MTQATFRTAIRRIAPAHLMSRTIPVWATILIGSALLNVAVYLSHIHTYLGLNDFRLFYAGAEIGLQYGWSHIYDVNLHQAAVAALRPTGAWFPLLTPAPITWLVAPLTVFGYPAAYWVWVGLNVAILAAAAWFAKGRQLPAIVYLAWWLSLAPLWFSAYEGQVTLLASAALLAGWRLLETRRDFAGGAVLAIALFKPYIVLLLPVALLLSGRFRALLGLIAMGGVAVAATLFTLRPEGIQAYVTLLLMPKPAADSAETLAVALGGGEPVFVIKVLVVLALMAVCLAARSSKTSWPVVTSAVLGSFLLAGYWHPQDYLLLDSAAAIMLIAAPANLGVTVAAAAVVLSTPMSPLTNRQDSPQMVVAWVGFAILLLGVLAFGAFRTRFHATDGSLPTARMLRGYLSNKETPDPTSTNVAAPSPSPASRVTSQSSGR